MKRIGSTIDAEEALREHTSFIGQNISKIIKIPQDMERDQSVKFFQ